MKLTILTTVWKGEFDEAEFPHYDRHVNVGEQVNVYEIIELGPNSRIRIEN